MHDSFRRIAVAFVALTAIGAGAAVPVSAFGAVNLAKHPKAASTTLIKACVHKKSGAMKLSTSGKCKKGERLVTWNQQGVPGTTGSTGASGAAGANGSPRVIVKDGSGNVVSDVVAIDAFGEGIMRLIDGRLWHFDRKGVVGGTGSGGVVFSDAQCTAANAYVTTDPTSLVGSQYVETAGSNFYTYTATSTTLAQGYRVNSVGTCVSDGWSQPKTSYSLTLVTPPSNLTGPLTYELP